MFGHASDTTESTHALIVCVVCFYMTLKFTVPTKLPVAKVTDVSIGCHIHNLQEIESPEPGGGGGRLLVNCVPMREQRTAKLALNSVFDILKLIPFSKCNPFQYSKLKHLLSYLSTFFKKNYTLFLQK